MQLYKNEQEFRDAIIAASNYYHISPSIVEKDYLARASVGAVVFTFL